MLTVQSQIQELVRQKMPGRQGDLLGLVDQLLALAEHLPYLRCTFAGEDRLRFEVRDQDPVEVTLPLAKARLRTMCARLARLCQESGGEFIPYGGEGVIKKAVVFPHANHDARVWHVRLKNTPSVQEFTITAVEDNPPCP
jgi:hypothetical protein